jgi:hypothetical protein
MSEKRTGTRGGEQAGKGSGEAHGAHGQCAVKQRQSQRALKAAECREEQIVVAGQGKTGSEANGKENDQGDDVA